MNKILTMGAQMWRLTKVSLLEYPRLMKMVAFRRPGILALA